MSRRFDVAVVGSGFAGSILAWGLAAAGRRVVLVERGSHPRFALGESSTPLAALALERLARRPGLEDLRDLATWGRWSARRSDLGRGLKRGFTFYRHGPGAPFANDDENSHRLLVAASPDDTIADVHWVRADTDAWLVRRAAEAGVEVRERTRLDGAEVGTRGGRLDGVGPEGPVRLEADFLVDATGAGRFLADSLGIADGTPPAPPRRLVFGHLEGLDDFVACARRDGARMPPGPYPDERAAVHHLLRDGWMYVLPFDHGVASCGLVLEGLDDREDPRDLWRRCLADAPTLATQFRNARFVVGPRLVPALARRRVTAVGERWVLLPHSFAFVDPMFSTGMAWSLLGVERLLEILLDGRGTLADYGRLLAAEAVQIENLVAAARRAGGPDVPFGRFVDVALLYFATVSFDEVRQRLLDAPTVPADLGAPDEGWCWRGFLAADDPVWRGVVAEAVDRVGAETSDEAFHRWVRAAIEPRDIAGWHEAGRRRLHPVDERALLARSDRLGLTRIELERRLPRLRGGGAA